jgi:hypothetical protein
MSFEYEERDTDSPVVRTVWRTRSESDGVYTACADGCWDLLVVKQGAATNVLLAGPSSKANPIRYVEGSEYLGIRFRRRPRGRLQRPAADLVALSFPYKTRGTGAF